MLPSLLQLVDHAGLDGVGKQPARVYHWPCVSKRVEGVFLAWVSKSKRRSRADKIHSAGRRRGGGV